MLSNRVDVRQADGRAIDSEQSKTFPGDGVEASFKVVDQMLVQLDKGFDFNFIRAFARATFETTLWATSKRLMALKNLSSSSW